MEGNTLEHNFHVKEISKADCVVREALRKHNRDNCSFKMKKDSRVPVLFILKETFSLRIRLIRV